MAHGAGRWGFMKLVKVSYKKRRFYLGYTSQKSAFVLKGQMTIKRHLGHQISHDFMPHTHGHVDSGGQSALLLSGPALGPPERG